MISPQLESVFARDTLSSLAANELERLSRSFQRGLNRIRAGRGHHTPDYKNDSQDCAALTITSEVLRNPTALHRNNGSVITIVSLCSCASISAISNFPERARLSSMAQRVASSRLLHSSILPTRFALSPIAIRPVAVPACQKRQSSHSPLGAAPATPRKKVTINTLRSLHQKQEPITMITAHDFPSAHVADHAGMDMILVGDSLAMVALGMEDTSEVVLEEMILHCRSVSRATKSAFTVVPQASFF